LGYYTFDEEEDEKLSIEALFKLAKRFILRFSNYVAEKEQPTTIFEVLEYLRVNRPRLTAFEIYTLRKTIYCMEQKAFEISEEENIAHNVRLRNLLYKKRLTVTFTPVLNLTPRHTNYDMRIFCDGNQQIVVNSSVSEFFDETWVDDYKSVEESKR